MYQNPDDFVDYSEYIGKLNEEDYTNPGYYRESPYPARSAQPVQSLDLAGYDGYPLPAGSSVSSPYGLTNMQEYRGPANMEGYTADAGAVQRDAAQHGTAEGSKRRKGLAGIGGALAGLGALLLKFGPLLKFGAMGLSALLSVAIYALIYGWMFAVGLVALLFIHEMGHAIAMKLKGIPVGGMVFIPMLGAVVTMRQMPRNAQDEAEIGIAGPIAGTLASSFCLFMAYTPNAHPVWAPLAYFGFFINLFNLVPIVPFDGGRVLAAIDRRVWIVGFLALLGFFLWQWLGNGVFSIWLLLFVVLAATQLWSRGVAPNASFSQDYYHVPVGTRIVLSVLYFGLIGVLVMGMTMAHALIPLMK